MAVCQNRQQPNKAGHLQKDRQTDRSVARGGTWVHVLLVAVGQFFVTEGGEAQWGKRAPFHGMERPH